jgi:hypothetical protein
MVTHSSTSRPVQCLCMAERTGCPVLTDLWSYVLSHAVNGYMLCNLRAYSLDRDARESESNGVFEELESLVSSCREYVGCIN